MVVYTCYRWNLSTIKGIFEDSKQVNKVINLKVKIV